MLQAEGDVNALLEGAVRAIVDRIKNKTQEKKFKHSSTIKTMFLLINMVELDHQRSAAKTLVNKKGLNT